MRRPDRVTLYAVYWPRERVFKVGRTTSWRQRITDLTSRGGEVLMLERAQPPEVERFVLDAMRESFPRAFMAEREALSIIPGGRGFTECFRVGWILHSWDDPRAVPVKHAVHGRVWIDDEGGISRRKPVAA